VSCPGIRIEEGARWGSHDSVPDDKRKREGEKERRRKGEDEKGGLRTGAAAFSFSPSHLLSFSLS